MADAASYLNQLSVQEAERALTRCCGAPRWVANMLALRPYASLEQLLAHAQAQWNALSEAEVLDAFRHHPRIGENLEALRARYAAKTAPDLAFSAREQAQVAEASEATLLALRDENAAYTQRFGFVFLVFASGKSAEEMLQLLRARLCNDRATEIANARAEHAKITALRLRNLAP